MNVENRLMGVLVYQTTNGNKVQINISTLPDGMYFLHLYDEISNKSEIKQIAVKH